MKSTQLLGQALDILTSHPPLIPSYEDLNNSYVKHWLKSDQIKSVFIICLKKCVERKQHIFKKHLLPTVKLELLTFQSNKEFYMLFEIVFEFKVVEGYYYCEIN